MRQQVAQKRQTILAICIHPGNLYWRRVLAGILESCRLRRWLSVAIPDTSEGIGLLSRQRIDAAVVNFQTPAVARLAAQLEIPLINLGHVDDGRPRVRLDDPAIGRAGAEALRAAGSTVVAFAGEHLGSWAVERLRGAQQACGRAWYGSAPSSIAAYEAWIAALPQHAGILTANDEIGAQMAQAAAAAGRSVPGSLRILGIDDDDLQCRHARTPLSSLRLDLEGLGAEAVAACARQLAGQVVPRDRRLADIAVVERSSTRGARLGGVREVMLRLASGSLEHLDVGRLAAGAGVSRRTLARRMARELELTPRQALLHSRLVRSEELLRSTADSLADIARSCGFASASHLCRHFRRWRKMTPGQWRRDFQG